IARPTILDAEGNGRVVSISGGEAVTLTGLSLTGGYAPDGAGLYVENVFEQDVTLTVQDSAIYSNTAQYHGGGIFVSQSGIYVSDSVIANNRTEADFGGGGGMALVIDQDSVYDIRHNRIANNYTPGTGGGIEFIGGLSAQMVVAGNEIMSNTAIFGGGLFAYTVQYLHIHNNDIYGNHSQQGGGIGFLSSFDISVENNRIHDNVVTAGDGSSAFINGQGGGIAVDYVAPLTMTNNVIMDNQAISGDGISINTDSDVRMFHNTLARNHDSAIQIIGAQHAGQHCYTFTFICTHVAMSNTLIVSHAVGISVTGLAVSVEADGILWHQTPMTTAVFTTTNTPISITHISVGDPLLAADGYHLLAGSAAVDQGVVTAVTHDIDNESRPQGLAPDLGADELLPLPPPDYKIYLPFLRK
ncbi:MAG: right-handed parallel beta-helix repeat-containing protein, partial [Anaerolineales bacterium]|nr:right-handed parallel beta-helix repeat-containing protein [Anaerolineales bacterium]